MDVGSLALAGAKLILGESVSARISNDWKCLGQYTKSDAQDKFFRIDTPASDPIRLRNDKKGLELICPCSQFLSDGGSIPSCLQKLDKNGKYVRLGSWDFPIPYLLHDAMYRSRKVIIRINGLEVMPDITRAEADSILAAAMFSSNGDGKDGARLAEASAIVEAVSFFGGFAWDSDASSSLPYTLFELPLPVA